MSRLQRLTGRMTLLVALGLAACGCQVNSPAGTANGTDATTTTDSGTGTSTAPNTGNDNNTSTGTDVGTDDGTGTGTTTNPGTTGSAARCGVVDGNVDAAEVDGLKVSGEPDDTYDEAIDVILGDNGTARIQGSICPTDDMDVYNLGPMAAGDRIRIDLQGSGDFDAEIAVFDNDDQLFIMNDDRDVNDLDPFVNEVVRHDSDAYYLAITSAPYTTSAGSYTASIIIGRGEPVPPPTPQPVLLGFDGGTITIPDYRTFTVEPFDAADIDSSYAGQTAEVIQAIVATVEADFAGIALEVYNTETLPAPAGLVVSTVYFGGRNRDLFGISQNVDPYNENPSDSSLIFTGDFSPRTFGRVLTVEELGKAIGNVAAHEIGHLVGLEHVADTMDLMDTTGSADTFLDDQTFQTSSLDWSIWPFGLQNGTQLLEETLGADDE